MAGAVKHMKRSHAGIDKNYSDYRKRLIFKPQSTKHQKDATKAVIRMTGAPIKARKVSFFRRIFRRFINLLNRKHRDR